MRHERLWMVIGVGLTFWLMFAAFASAQSGSFTSGQAKVFTALADSMERDSATVLALPADGQAELERRMGLAQGLRYSARMLRGLSGQYPNGLSAQEYYEASHGTGTVRPWRPQPWPDTDVRGTPKLLELLR